MDEKHLGIRLTRDQWQRLRIRSIEENRPTSEVVRDAIDLYLSRSKNGKPKAKASA